MSRLREDFENNKEYNSRELITKLLEATNKAHDKTIEGSGQYLHVSQLWVDKICENWDCTEDELRDMFSGKKPFPKK